jgi:FkbM family methyltransferase
MRIGHFWGHTFLEDRIRPSDTVFDIGLNYGGFSLIVAPFCRRVIGYEPNFYWNDRRPELPANVTVVNKAVAANKGTVTFYCGQNGSPNSTILKAAADKDSSVHQVEAVTLSEVFEAEPAGRIGFLKIDIEGEEVACLQSAPEEHLLRVAQISVEFESIHSDEAIQAVIEKMEGLGFWTMIFTWRNYNDVLFVNQKLEQLSIYEKSYLILYKYISGILRRMRRATVGWLNRGIRCC